MEPTIVGANVDTWILNVHRTLSCDLDEQLEALKQASQEAEDDIPTDWTFKRNEETGGIIRDRVELAMNNSRAQGGQR